VRGIEAIRLDAKCRVRGKSKSVSLFALFANPQINLQDIVVSEIDIKQGMSATTDERQKTKTT